jgi:hypothetical protein
VGGDFSIGELVLAGEVSSADWIVGGVRDFEYDVGSLVPVGFDAYARVLHPAGRHVDGGVPVEVSWAEVAAANGRVAHGAMEWLAITGDWKYLNGAGQPGIWDQPPSTGSLPARQAAVLAGVLSAASETPSEGWFAIWDGYGDAAYRREAVPKVPMPNRPMVLFEGPLHAVTTSFARLRDQRANLWWPGDRRWCVATDVDLMSTYVGGNASCIAAVPAENQLETFPVSVDQSVTWSADVVNPKPAGVAPFVDDQPT